MLHHGCHVVVYVSTVCCAKGRWHALVRHAVDACAMHGTSTQ